MRRSTRLALALSLCALGAPAVAHGANEPATPSAPGAPGVAPGEPAPPKAVASPFKRDRASSRPFGLTPDNVATPFRYPEEPVVLTWGEVPGAAGYAVEVSSTPGFTDIAWESETAQPVAVPDVLLPDGWYWWRVKAVDAAGTVGLASEVARFAKTWPNQVAATRLSATPGGPAVSHLTLNPYLSWSGVAGAQVYDVEISPGDQFGRATFFGRGAHSPFVTPAIVGGIPDDTYAWRVRARDPKGNAGPWAVAPAFTKGWVAPAVVSPADDAVTHSLMVTWSPVEGAEQYQVQMSNLENNFSGDNLKVNALTSATAFAPSLTEQAAKGLTHGDVYWRVRPVIAGGIFGTWSHQRHIDWQPAPVGVRTSVAVLSSSGDSDTGLSPHLAWTPVRSGGVDATLYRVDIAGDPQFNNIVESQLTTSTGWSSRSPLPDNQIGTGYYWRVVWGSGSSEVSPGWMVDEASVAVGQFKKQTRIALGSASGGQLVDAAPMLTWTSVPGIAKYEVQLSRDGRFAPDETTRTATVYGTGAVPGSMASDEKRLPDGTWSWRVRAVDGGGAGQTWSPVGSFTLTQPRPAQKSPNDGATAVLSPLLTWGAVPGACAYEVGVSRDPSFKASATGGDPLTTAQTALLPPKGTVTTPGRHYWRVRADYCDGPKGQWSTTRSFHSVFPPDFNLNSIPRKVEYRKRVVLAGQLRNNGAVVKRARLYLERRVWPRDEFRPAGTIRTNKQGRFRFSLRMTRSASYRLVWRETAKNPQGTAVFGINVAPRVVFRLASGRVVRRSGLRVKGAIFPKRPAVIQLKTSDGWETIRKLTPRRARFSVSVSTRRIEPGRHRLRLWVPRDRQRKLVNAASRQRGVLVYDRFVIRGGR
jgi:hypothetical protein